jgi:hypothetical protein
MIHFRPFNLVGFTYFRLLQEQLQIALVVLHAFVVRCPGILRSAIVYTGDNGHAGHVSAEV